MDMIWHNNKTDEFALVLVSVKVEAVNNWNHK